MFTLALVLALVSPALQEHDAAGFPERMVVLVVWDGMRPDLIGPERTPRLHALAGRGVLFHDHHALVPTKTRVNAAVLATGCLPHKTGILGNQMHAPELGPGTVVDVSDRDRLLAWQQALGRPLVTCRTLGDHLRAHGRRFVIASSASSGTTFLLDPTGQGSTLHPGFCAPDALAAALPASLRADRPDAGEFELASRHVLRGWREHLLPALRPDLSIIWFGNVDKDQHATGLGAPAALAAIRFVDGLLGEIVDAVDDLGLGGRTTWLVTSDHGFANHVGGGDLGEALVRRRLKRDRKSEDIVIADGAIYVREGGPQRVTQIAQALAELPWTGPIFAREARAGTCDMQEIGWLHARAADLLVVPRWEDRDGPFGWRGVSYAQGIAGHGGTSPFEIRATLVVAGRGCRIGTHSAVPSSHADLAPTICALLGLPLPPAVDGRPLREALTDGPHAWAVRWQRQIVTDAGTGTASSTSSVETDAGRIVRYFDWAQRRPSPGGR